MVVVPVGAGVAADRARHRRSTVDQQTCHRRHRGEQPDRRQRCPGPLSSEYASAAGPIVALVDQLRQQHREQVVVLIPVAAPDRLRYRTLHNHFDLVLTAALRDGPDIITARVPTPLRLDDGPAAAMRSFAGTDT